MKKMINRRQMLKLSVAGAVVVAAPQIAKAAPKKLPCGLKELPLITMKFDEEGNFVNQAEVFAGSVWEIDQVRQDGANCSGIEYLMRQAKAYLPSEYSVDCLVDDDSHRYEMKSFHGEMLITESVWRYLTNHNAKWSEWESLYGNESISVRPTVNSISHKTSRHGLFKSNW